MKVTRRENGIEKTDEFEMTDNNHVTKATDKYADAIDLSNACREFYQTRKRAAEAVKEKLASSGRQRTAKKKTSIDVAMETLSTEMASLMDQDLSLMKQLLTLNEAIEDLKWQRNYYHSQSSIPQSSCDVSESDWSVSETDMFGSENEAVEKLTPSSLLIPTSITKTDVINDIDTTEREYIVSTVSETHASDRESVKVSNFEVPVDTRSFLEYPAKLDLFLNGNSRLCHEEQNTFDSGIREPIVRKEIAV